MTSGIFYIQIHQFFIVIEEEFMLFSLALILLVGFGMSGIFQKINLPGILAMIITGIILGPFALDLISSEILDISSDLREIALIVILLRAGLTLDIDALKKVGRPALLMCFIPATLELIGVVIFAPMLFGISYIEAAIMGSVMAAVSPAVVVPRMIYLIETGHGKNKSIPHLIMAGASVDDVYVIILFTSFLGMYKGEGFNALSLALVPISIILGLLLGVITGLFTVKLFKKIHTRDTVKVLIILSLSFLLITLEKHIKSYFPISGLLAVMALGGTILKSYDILAKRLMGKFSKIWVGAEIMLFVLVGAAVDIRLIAGVGILAVILILIALVFRVTGVGMSLIKTSLNNKERFFCAIAYIPKATVQAAIGAIPLTMGVPSGNLILTVAVLTIMITAPLGAIGIDNTYRKLLLKLD
jgi:NhaP-type Na+/H+ or K+/H+ antiporter